MAAEFEMGQLMLILSLLFVLAFSASALFKRFGIPGLIGEILVGIIVANIIIGDWTLLGALGVERPYYDEVLHVMKEGNVYWEVLEVFAELGVVFLLFTVGLETKARELMSVGRAAMFVATLGVIVPFIFGYIVVMLLWEPNMYHALFMGAAMVATSVGITAQVIKDLHLMNSTEARIIIGAAVIDDILGLIVLTIVAGMASTGNIDIISIGEIVVISAMFVLAIIFFCMKGVPRIAGKIEENYSKKRESDPNWKPKTDFFAIALITCLLLSTLAAQMQLAMIVGAFLAGMIFADHAHDLALIKKMESVTALLLPFFFVFVGLHIDLTSFTLNLLLFAGVVIILAMVGKYIGCGLGNKIGDKQKRSSSHIVGVGMIPRGEVGIIVATIGIGITFSDGTTAMSSELFAVVVMMSVITTIVAPFLLSGAFKKKYKGHVPGAPPEHENERTVRKQAVKNDRPKETKKGPEPVQRTAEHAPAAAGSEPEGAWMESHRMKDFGPQKPKAKKDHPEWDVHRMK